MLDLELHNLYLQLQAASAASGNSSGGANKPSGSSLSVSPAPQQPQRIPSPQELVFHAQQIMQNALIKRKLEEQKENYRSGNSSPKVAVLLVV